MGLTERQKTEFKNIAKELVSELLNDTVFLDTIAKSVAEKVNEQLTTKINKLESKISDIQIENEDLRCKIDYLEQNEKSCSLRLYGMNEDNNINLKHEVEDIFSSKLGHDVKIIECYRAGKRQNSQKKPRVIIMKFENTFHRNLVFSAKKKLKGTKLVLMEDLTKARYNLMMYAKDKIGQKNVWSTGGNIYTMVNNKKVHIRTESDVTDIIGE